MDKIEVKECPQCEICFYPNEDAELCDECVEVNSTAAYHKKQGALEALDRALEITDDPASYEDPSEYIRKLRAEIEGGK